MMQGDNRKDTDMSPTPTTTTTLTQARNLKRGMVLALPFGKSATIQDDPRVGRSYVSFRTEHGRTRIGVHDEVLIHSQKARQTFAAIYMRLDNAAQAFDSAFQMLLQLPESPDKLERIYNVNEALQALRAEL